MSLSSDRKKYVLYLHPKEGTEEYSQFNNFWYHTSREYSDEIFNMIYHCSLSEFFETNDISKLKRLLSDIIESPVIINNIKPILDSNKYGFSFSSDQLKKYMNRISKYTDFIKSPSEISRNSLNFIKIHKNLEIILGHHNYKINPEADIFSHFNYKNWDRKWIVILWKIEDGMWKIEWKN